MLLIRVTNESYCTHKKILAPGSIQAEAAELDDKSEQE